MHRLSSGVLNASGVVPLTGTTTVPMSFVTRSTLIGSPTRTRAPARSTSSKPSAETTVIARSPPTTDEGPASPSDWSPELLHAAEVTPTAAALAPFFRNPLRLIFFFIDSASSRLKRAVTQKVCEEPDKL